MDKKIRLGVASSDVLDEGEWIDHPTIEGVRVRAVSPKCERIDKMMNRLLDKYSKNGRRNTRAAENSQAYRETRAACIMGLEAANGHELLDANGENVVFSPELMQEWANDWPHYFPFLEPLFTEIDRLGEEDQRALEKSARD
jgi:hypothetical protein